MAFLQNVNDKCITKHLYSVYNNKRLKHSIKGAHYYGVLYMYCTYHCCQGLKGVIKVAKQELTEQTQSRVRCWWSDFHNNSVFCRWSQLLELLKKVPIHFHECLGLDCVEYSRSKAYLQGEENTTEMQQHTLLEACSMQFMILWVSQCRNTYLLWANKDSRHGREGSNLFLKGDLPWHTYLWHNYYMKDHAHTVWFT